MEVVGERARMSASAGTTSASSWLWRMWLVGAQRTGWSTGLRSRANRMSVAPVTDVTQARPPERSQW